MLNVKITIDNGNGKQAEIQLNEADNLAKLVIIQNVFSLFGIEKDLVEQVKMFDNAAKAYSEFFNETNSIEPNWNEVKEEDSIDIKQKLIDSYEENREELEATYKETNDPTDLRVTGIKVRDGKQLYQLRYSCPACWNKGTHFVHLNSKMTWCHRCHHEFKIYPAHPSGDISQRDSFGNFFRAGEYKDMRLDWGS